MTYKKVSILVALASLLSGCANYVWVGAQPQFDIDACTAEANQTYPLAIYSYQSSQGYTTPTRTSCSSYGNQTNCTSTGGQYIPPTQSLADANEANRKGHFNSCMIKRGNRLMDESEYRKIKHSNSANSPQPIIPPADKCSGGKYSVYYDPKVCE